MVFYEKLGLILIMALFTSDWKDNPLMGILLLIGMILFVFGKEIDSWSKKV